MATEIPGMVALPLVAQRLRLTYHAALKLVLTGKLEGEKVGGTRWFVTARSLDEYQRRASLHPETAR